MQPQLSEAPLTSSMPNEASDSGAAERPTPPQRAFESLPRLSLWHAVALALVGLLTIGSYIILSRVTVSSTDTGTILSTSQLRVIAQRIAVYAAVILTEDDPSEIAAQQTLIRRYADQFRSLHAIVCNQEDDGANLSAEMRSIFEQPPYEVDRYAFDFAALADTIAALPTELIAANRADIHELVDLALPLDVGLTRLISQIRDERYERVQSLQNLELLMMVGTLTSLVIIGAVILWPLQSQVRAVTSTLIREIRTRSDAEAALSESEARYRSLVSALSEGVIMYDRSGQMVTYNTSAERILGLTLAPFIGRVTFSETMTMIHPDGRTQTPDERPVMRTLLTGKPQEGIVFGKREGDGPVTWMEINVQPVYKHGELDGAVASLTDITASKRITEELERGRVLMTMILDHSPDAIFVVDRASRILLANRAELGMMGLGDETAALGKTVFDIYTAERAQGFYASEQAVMASGEIVLDKLEHLHDEQGDRWFSVAKVPLRDSSGTVIGMLGMSRDITTRMRVEQQQKQLEREHDKVAILADLMRDTAHELRTPLSLINTSLYLLRRTDDADKRAERIAAVEDQVKYLTTLLEQMANLAALDQSGDFALNEVNLHDILNDVAAIYRPQIEAQYKTLAVDLCAAPPIIHANARQFQFAIRQLLDNALTYTHEGGLVTLRTSCIPDGVVIEVIDNGIGMNPDEVSHIFDRFYKADPARTLGKGGVGLGLSIVKRIIGLHKGTVMVESVPGEGSCFRITLPVLTATGATTPTAVAKPSAPRNGA